MALIGPDNRDGTRGKKDGSYSVSIAPYGGRIIAGVTPLTFLLIIYIFEFGDDLSTVMEVSPKRSVTTLNGLWVIKNAR